LRFPPNVAFPSPQYQDFRFRQEDIDVRPWIWLRPDDVALRGFESFTVTTTIPNALMVTLHDRMPCILASNEYRRWLEPNDPARPPIDLLRPYASESMRCWPVDQRVGNVRNDDKQLIEPLSPTPVPSPNLSLFPES
jgi:hypothetical protein